MHTTAIVIHPIVNGAAARDPQSALNEALGLAEAINLDVHANELIRVNRVSPATLLGGGQVSRLKNFIADNKIVLAIVDYTLSPSQQRNLERAWNCKVIDRTGLILEIFGERARTREGQLQVELAAMTYQRSRLVRSWTHLERQRASGNGAGFLGGPGESQLELDRRLIDARIDRIKLDLADVRRTRGLQRRARDRRGQRQVALVGYTNAGKSTLFNQLTASSVLAKDMLFATLDPTLRRLDLDGEEIMLADTVGFIADLPTGLVEAFRATLEEVTAADLILHVRDSAHADTMAQRQDVVGVLADLGIEESDPRIIEVLNKADLLPPQQRQLLRQQQAATVLTVSALTGQGLDTLRNVVKKRLFQEPSEHRLSIPHGDGAARAWLYAHGEVIAESADEQRQSITVKLTQDKLKRYKQKFMQADDAG